MILVKAEMIYDSLEKLKKLSDEEYAAFVEKYEDLGLSKERGSYFYHAECLIDLAIVDELTELGYKMAVSKIKGLKYLEDISSRNASNTTNITNVSVANHNLFCVDEVTFLEDCCTNEIQKMLDKGWRLLAVCPSNDARRPDYILGRDSKNGEK